MTTLLLVLLGAYVLAGYGVVAFLIWWEERVEEYPIIADSWPVFWLLWPLFLVLSPIFLGSETWAALRLPDLFWWVRRKQ